MSRHALFIVILVQSTKLRVQSQHHDLIADYLKHAQLSKSTKLYNPNYGYEPYWVNGDWFFKQKVLPPGFTTTAVPLVCGEECIDLYTTVGKVCARQVNNLNFDGFIPAVTQWYFQGHVLDDHSKGFYTFETYCKFLDAQCRTEMHNRWILVHRGECVYPQHLLFKQRFDDRQMVDRATYDLTSLASLFDNYTIENTILGQNSEELIGNP